MNRKKVLGAPLYVCWDITYRCNLKCLHCCFGDKNTKANIQNETISIKRIFEILDELEDIGVLRLEIAGGEPLLYPYFDELVNYLQKKNFEISLVTNGLLLNEEKVRLLKKCNLSQIQISLDGYTKELHEKIRGENTFEKTLEKIRLVKRANINLVVAAVIYRDNYKYLDEFIEFLYKINIYHFRIQFLLSLGKTIENADVLLITEDEQDYAINTIKNNYHVKHGDINVIMPCFYNKIVENKIVATESEFFYTNSCGAGVLHANINPYGDVTGCTMLTDEKWIEGNIKNSSFKEIWRNEKCFMRWRNEYTINGFCRDCCYINECKKGCKALTFTCNSDEELRKRANCFLSI